MPGLEGERVIQREPESAIAFGGTATARVLDQDLPHKLGADCQEMFAILELTCALFFEPQIGLMHKGGALQGVVRTFFLQIVVRHFAKFVINEGNESAQSLVITGMPVRQ